MLFQETATNQLAQPTRKDRASDAQVIAEIIETTDTPKSGPQHQDGPPIPHERQRLLDGCTRPGFGHFGKRIGSQ